jgi:hypothetical protein
VLPPKCTSPVVSAAAAAAQAAAHPSTMLLVAVLPKSACTCSRCRCWWWSRWAARSHDILGSDQPVDDHAKWFCHPSPAFKPLPPGHGRGSGADAGAGLPPQGFWFDCSLQRTGK